jgi:pimeloyl-ACP methyl ester carboxylesterase
MARMADDLVIRSSGAAAIDTASLRSAATAARSAALRLRGVDSSLASAAAFIASVPGVRAARDVHHELARERSRVETLAEDCEGLSTALDRSADLYELVEVHAAWALSQPDDAERAALEARASTLGTRLWGVAGSDAAFDMLIRTGGFAGGDDGTGLRMQAALGAGLIGGLGAAPVGWALAAAVQLGAARAGALRDGTVRVPAAAVPAEARGTSTERVAVTPLRRLLPTPVAGFADAGRRIPGSEASRIRVERYTMPGGGREWVVYVTGTQSAGLGGAEPFDMRSNLTLYSGRDAASSTAVRAALADAGVAPGDPVHAFAHSQGAMVAEALARDGEYDIETLVTFGAPTTGPLPADVTAVTVRHTDDPVAALAGPLPAAERGAPGGFVVERMADPLPGPRDLTMPAHALQAYVETGGLLDGSKDPRVRAVDPLWDRLGRAESVRATEYGAERVSRADAADAG